MVAAVGDALLRNLWSDSLGEAVCDGGLTAARRILTHAKAHENPSKSPRDSKRSFTPTGSVRFSSHRMRHSEASGTLARNKIEGDCGNGRAG